MKRCLTLVSLAVFSVAVYGQAPSTPDAATSPTTTQQSEATRTPSSVRGASVSAELTKGVDTKRAKVGDAIEARVTSTAKLPDGTELPRGTKLIGKITDVRASSKQDKNAHLAFNIDHAQLKDGQQVPVHAALTSVTAPAQSNAPDLPMSGGSAAAGGPAGGTGSSAGAAPVASSTPAMTSSQPVTSRGGTLTGGQDHVPVGNLPGVMLTGTSDANSAGSLDALGQNIDLASGTKLTLNLSTGA